MIISIKAEKAPDKIQHRFIKKKKEKKPLQKVSIKETHAQSLSQG